MTQSLRSPQANERSLTLSVTPIGKPRMTRRDKWLSPPRPAVASYRAFADRLRLECGRHRFTLPTAGLSIVFSLPMPTSWSAKKKEQMCTEPHQQKPDLDNLVKAVFDALLGEDCAIWHLGSVEKRWRYEGEITFTTPNPQES